MMRKLFYLLLLPLIFSCGKESSEKAGSGNILENLTFTVDTVIVDSGDQIIDLSSELSISTISNSSKELYLFDRKGVRIQIIDLDNLRISKSIPFEKEGPNGVGTIVHGIKILADDKLTIAGFPKIGVFDSNGVLNPKQSFNLNDLRNEEMSQPFLLRPGFSIDEINGIGYFLSAKTITSNYRLAIADFNINEVEFLDLPELDEMKDFRIFFNDNGLNRYYSEKIRIKEIQSKTYLSSSFTSTIYEFDHQSDSLRAIKFIHTIVPNEKSVRIENEVLSEAGAKEQLLKKKSDISFHELIWDRSSNRFFRFASRVIGSKSAVEDVHEVFLFAYDEHLKLLGETQLKDLPSVPAYPFFKDGKLWSYVNVEDELGFAVMDFKF